MWRVVIAVMALAGAVPVHAQDDNGDWFWVTDEQTGTRIGIRFSDAFQGSTNRRARFWEQMDASQAPSIAWRRSMTLIEMNCVEQTYRVIQSTFYFPDGSSESGSVNGRSEYIIPETNMATLMYAICQD